MEQEELIKIFLEALVSRLGGDVIITAEDLARIAYVGSIHVSPSPEGFRLVLVTDRPAGASLQ